MYPTKTIYVLMKEHWRTTGISIVMCFDTKEKAELAERKMYQNSYDDESYEIHESEYCDF